MFDIALPLRHDINATKQLTELSVGSEFPSLLLIHITLPNLT